MKSVDLDELHRLYIIEKKPMSQTAAEMGISVGLVHKLLHKNGIPIHRIMPPKSEAEKQRISKLHKGKVLTEETRRKISDGHKLHGIGHKKKRMDGYIAVYYPGHPCATNAGYIMEHRYLMEQSIGRLLKPDEVVHHINHNRADNRLENLQLLTNKEHAALHMRERHANQRRNDLSIKLS